MRSSSKLVAAAALLAVVLVGAAPADALNTPVSSGYVQVAPLNTTIDRRIHPAEKVMEEGHSYVAGAPDATYRALAPWETSVSAHFTGLSLTAPTYLVTAVGGSTTTDLLGRAASDAGNHPGHIWIICAINERFNHGGAPIAPSTTQSNLASYMSTVQATAPGVRFHVLGDYWDGSEAWPDGSGPHDATTTAALNAEKTACQANPFCEYLDTRTPMYSTTMPAQNPGDATCGVLTQSAGSDCTHPTKAASGGASISGDVAISNGVFSLTTMNP